MQLQKKKKDIERAFGILQARCHVLTTGCCLWDCQAMKLVIKTFVILNNMVLIDFECANNLNPEYVYDDVYVSQHEFTIIPHNPDHLCEDQANMMIPKI